MQISKGPLQWNDTEYVLSPSVMSNDNTCEKCQPGKLITDSAARVFIGSYRQPVLVTSPNCRLQKESRCLALIIVFVQTI